MEGSIETIATNNLLLIFSMIIITGIALGRISEILKVPDVILYLIAGIIIGPAFLNILSIGSFKSGDELYGRKHRINCYQ